MKESINQINLNWQWTKLKAMDVNTSDYIFLARDNVKKLKNEKHYLYIQKKRKEKKGEREAGKIMKEEEKRREKVKRRAQERVEHDMT